jgi:peptidoglycan/LPS O-acetylase OafA/YrhL
VFTIAVYAGAGTGGYRLHHRNDIDGLRSIAVLPILLFHAGVSALPGGFLGVDIFFVISGYLITGILARDMAAERFSLWRFYQRRAVRIFPALFAMLAAVLVIGVVVLLPNELARLGTSAAASAAFVSNIFFWHTVDYFGGLAETKPLLHTWSLGVEEQFYLFFPVLLLAARRWLPRLVVPLLWVAVVGSFALGWVLAQSYPTGAFYLIPTRAWELAIGGLVALGAFPKLGAGARQAAAVAGLALIVASIVVIDASWSIPSPWSLPSCLGAALLIAYGEGALTARVLTLSPMRWVGAISYSLYLWHWPIITFWRLTHTMELAAVETVLLVGASIAAGAASYYLIEQPVLRRYRGDPRARGIALVGLAGVAATVLVSWGVARFGPEAIPLDPAIRRVAAWDAYSGTPEQIAQFREGTCFASGENARFDYDACLKLSDSKRNVVLLGDSHAAQYWRPLATRFPDVNLLQATASSCVPTLDTEGDPRCTKLDSRVLGPLVDTGRIDRVVLAGRWRDEHVAKLLATIRHLQAKGVKVTVLGPIVEYEGEFPALLARAMKTGRVGEMDRYRLRDPDAIDRRLAPLIRATGATYVSMRDAECPGGKCAVVAPDGAPLHFDYGHFTQSGAAWVTRVVPAL